MTIPATGGIHKDLEVPAGLVRLHGNQKRNNGSWRGITDVTLGLHTFESMKEFKNFGLHLSAIILVDRGKNANFGSQEGLSVDVKCH